MIVVDSSGWIEFFADGPLAARFAPHLRNPGTVLTPAIVVYEVYKWIKRERDEPSALAAVASMRKTRIVDVTAEIAIRAADLSLEHRIAMADAVVLAVAGAHGVDLLTADSGFNGIDGVIVLAKKQSR